MKLDGLEVAIAGAGIGGLALATMLGRCGANVVIHDQMDKPGPVGSGFVIQPTGAAILDTLGLLEAVERRGKRIDRMIGRLPRSGRVVLDVGYRQGQYGVAVQRPALFDVLFGAARDAGVRFVSSARVSGVTPGARPSFEVEGGDRAAPADLLVDAMGANSPLGPAPKATELHYGALWATVPWNADGPFVGNLLEQRYRSASQMAGVLPVGTAVEGASERATFFWSLRNDSHGAWKAQGRSAWIDEVAKIWPEAAPLAEAAEPVHARYRHFTRAPVIGQNVVRIGDAWHATSPQLGQGANMAMLDAASLAAALIRAPSMSAALEMHLRQRKLHVQIYQLLSGTLTPFYQSDSRLLPAMRDLAIGPVTVLPGVRRVITALVTGDIWNPVGRIAPHRFDAHRS